MRDRVVLEFKPYGGPRRRVIFEPASSVDEWEFGHYRIDEVYSVEKDRWRETGREHVTEPDLMFESDDGPVGEEAIADA